MSVISAAGYAVDGALQVGNVHLRSPSAHDPELNHGFGDFHPNLDMYFGCGPCFSDTFSHYRAFPTADFDLRVPIDGFVHLRVVLSYNDANSQVFRLTSIQPQLPLSRHGDAFSIDIHASMTRRI